DRLGEGRDPTAANSPAAPGYAGRLTARRFLRRAGVSVSRSRETSRGWQPDVAHGVLAEPRGLVEPRGHLAFAASRSFLGSEHPCSKVCRTEQGAEALRHPLVQHRFEQAVNPERAELAPHLIR